jgi:hypothetical protein
MAEQPRTLAEFIDAIRAGLICDRCGRYVGGLSRGRFRPAPYPVALDKIGAEDEAEALIGFEWHMVDLLRRGNFVIRHPQRDGRCVTLREWAADDDDEPDDAHDGTDE